jgi:hypothetical protein
LATFLDLAAALGLAAAFLAEPVFFVVTFLAFVGDFEDAILW